MGDDTEWIKLPTDEKCQHKAWKARLAGYEEAIKLFQTIGDEKSPEFSKYLGLIKKLVVDNNAIAQEKGLEATLAFVESAFHAGKTAGEVCGGVIAKCLNQRAKTKDLGVAILMAYIEAEKQEIVQEELMKGLTNKQPKIVAACVVALKEALRDFGTKIILIKPILKQLQALLEDRDKTVRDETKLLVVEIYRWIGPALKPQIANLKPVQVTELESEFEKLPSGKPQQTRFLRSQQDLKAKMMERAAAGEGEATSEVDGGGAAVAEEVDAYELLDPVDILSKLPKDFFEKIEEKKWQDRKEALEAVQKLAENPKLEQGDYNELMRALKKVVSKDTNVMLVTIAAKCIGLIATGLRKKFSPYSVACIESLIEKFREKKQSVVQVLKESIDACYAATTLEGISEVCIAALNHKTPSVKAETASFLARCFCRCTPVTLPKKLLKLFVTDLLKTVNDTAPEVREASFEALGTAMKVITEKAMLPFLADVDALKMAKIKECCEKAVVLGKGSAPAKPPAAGDAAAAKTAAAPAKAGPPAKSAAASKPAAKKAPDSSASSGGPPAAAAGGKKKPPAKGKKNAPKEEVLERELSDEVVEEKMSDLFPGGSLAGLENSNWKERLASVEKMIEVLRGLSREEIPVQAFVRTIMKKPGLKENNFQVLKLKVELISSLAQNGVFSKRSAEYCLNDLIDKIGDAKNSGPVQECLSWIAEATSLDFVAQQVLACVFEGKNPKNQSEALNWLSNALKQFGFKLTVKPIVETVGKALSSANPAVRTSAITLLGVMFMYMGATLRVFFDNEKPALLQQIDAEFEKVKGEKPPAPTRGNKKSEEGGGDAADEDEGEAGEEAAAAINVADLIPRVDICDKMTEALMTELGDKNWKVRKEALEKVQATINEAKFITANIGPLPEALKPRLGDSNKILATMAINICQTLAMSMGSNIKQHVRTLVPGIISNFGDSKPNIRQVAVAALNVWLEQIGPTGLVSFVEAELFSDALKLENPFLRAELLGWLSEKLPNSKKLPPELNECIPHLYACLEDRNADVRKKAQEALVPFMVQVGFESMVRKVGQLKPASKDSVMKMVEQARTNLPQKPVKAAAPAAAPVVKGGGGKARPKEEVNDYEDDVEDSRPPSSSSSKTTVAGGAKGKAKPNGAAPAASGLAKKGTIAAAATAAPTKKKGQEEEDTSPPLRVSNGKDQRTKDEKNLKVFKWNFDAPRREFLEQLKIQMEPTFNKTMMDQLFHVDFKFHIKAMDTLIKVCEGGTDSTIANLDLILKWLTLRFFDTNTTVLLKALEYLLVIFPMLAEEKYHLTDMEASSFIPYLINKVGDPKDNIRRDVRSIMQLLCTLYSNAKVFNYIVEGLKSKNAKQRTECLEELGNLISTCGLSVCQPSPAIALKVIASQISDRDNSVRSAALNTVVAAHDLLGDNVFKYVGQLSEKDMSMLEERIKRSVKSKPPGQSGAPSSNPVAAIARQTSPDEKPKTTKMAAPQGQGLQRPMEVRTQAAASRSKGQFSLDFEEETTEVYAMPKLIEPDLNDILNEPIKLPVTRMRPPSPSLKLLHTSADAKSAVDLVISQIASNDINTSLQALHQIDEVLKDVEKSEALQTHVDQLLITCTLQLRVTYTKHMSDDSMYKDVIRLYKCLLATLLSLCKCSSLAHEATRDVLKDLIYNLITILIDNRLSDVEDGPEVIRAVNVTVVKIVEHMDVTNVMSALIKLLHDTVGIETCSPHFLELVMKCLWKMVRMLPTIINDLNLDRVIAEMHTFLKAFPTFTWKSRTTDMPLRTIKTILHSLARLKGSKVLNHLTLIDRSDHSEVESYLRKVLKSTSESDSVSATNSKNEQMNGSIEQLSSSSASSKLENSELGLKSPRRISRSVHDQLADIFKKIGSKENTREGLNNLYDFKMKHPDADLDPFLKKSSQFFQDYIERGLKNIELEREGCQKTNGSSTVPETSNVVPSTNPHSSSTDLSAAEYMERLKVLRARCGLDNADATSRVEAPLPDSIDNKSDSSRLPSARPPSSMSSKLASTLTSSQNATNELTSEQTSSTNLDELKRRLERIKNARKD